jgi:hypothetical protein
MLFLAGIYVDGAAEMAARVCVRSVSIRGKRAFMLPVLKGEFTKEGLCADWLPQSL